MPGSLALQPCGGASSLLQDRIIAFNAYSHHAGIPACSVALLTEVSSHGLNLLSALASSLGALGLHGQVLGVKGDHNACVAGSDGCSTLVP